MCLQAHIEYLRLLWHLKSLELKMGAEYIGTTSLNARTTAECEGPRMEALAFMSLLAGT